MLMFSQGLETENQITKICHQNLICSISANDLHPYITQERKKADQLMLLLITPQRGRAAQKGWECHGMWLDWTSRLWFVFVCITGAWCQTFPPWKECLPNQFHVNGLGGNHSPLVGLRVQPLRHTNREIWGYGAGLEVEQEKIS